ncbi:MAG: NUDIX domain-containing protein [Oscillospiraceae bacterium]|nr:NUDIX domain-containing protein [Oscillospiraceae bacterium]
MKYEKSCGAIIIRKAGAGCETLLIRHVNGGHWSFPKGHVEKGETETETALREIREETGLNVALDTGFRSVTAYSPKPGVSKDVVYFLAKAKEGAPVPQREEVLELGWYAPEEAEKKITYENDRRLFRSARAYLEKGQTR